MASRWQPVESGRVAAKENRYAYMGKDSVLNVVSDNESFYLYPEDGIRLCRASPDDAAGAPVTMTPRRIKALERLTKMIKDLPEINIRTAWYWREDVAVVEEMLAIQKGATDERAST